MLERLLPKLDYGAVVQACRQLKEHLEGRAEGGNDGSSSTIQVPVLPEDMPTKEQLSDNETLVSDLHRVLFDLHVIEGNLVCPDTGRKFPVKDGIPNMILHEDEL